MGRTAQLNDGFRFQKIGFREAQFMETKIPKNRR